MGRIPLAITRGFKTNMHPMTDVSVLPSDPAVICREVSFFVHHKAENAKHSETIKRGRCKNLKQCEKFQPKGREAFTLLPVAVQRPRGCSLFSLFGTNEEEYV